MAAKKEDSDVYRQFAFGYSDIVNVFINGQIVFSGNQMYRSRSAGYLGAIGLNDMLYLPLREGRNELLFVVFEVFGGWGLMAQDLEDDYLEEGIIEVWEQARELKVPESAVYDRKRDILYAIDRRNLVVIDIESATITNRYPVPEPRFVNDVVVDAGGNVYISDNDGNKIFRFSDGQFEVWLEGDEVLGPNGLFIDGEHLLYGNTDGDVKRVGLASKQIGTLTNIGWGSKIDGFTLDGKGNYLVSDYNGRIVRVTPARRYQLASHAPDCYEAGATGGDAVHPLFT